MLWDSSTICSDMQLFRPSKSGRLGRAMLKELHALLTPFNFEDATPDEETI